MAQEPCMPENLGTVIILNIENKEEPIENKKKIYQGILNFSI